jgi:hypothetical protein
VLVLAALAACGGDGGGDGGRLSLEEWVARADAVCAQAERELEALGEPATPAELADLAEEAVSISERQLGRLRELRPPQDAEEDYASMIDLTAEQIAISRTIADEAEEGDTARIQALVREAEALIDEAGTLAAKYGFEECAAD